jgi:hypothetical protein
MHFQYKCKLKNESNPRGCQAAICERCNVAELDECDNGHEKIGVPNGVSSYTCKNINL